MATAHRFSVLHDHRAMSDRRIKLLLFLTILVVSALPLLAAFYFLDRSLQTSLSLGFNPQIAAVLEDGSRNLLVLKSLDPERQAEYRKQFESIEELRHVYADPALIRNSILDSLRIYFGLGLVASVVFSLVVAGALSRRIARAYTLTFDELIAQRERVRYLQEMASWQELAKMLAHEIKNPLTPIEVLVSSLRKAHEQLDREEFRDRLGQTQAMIGDELQHLQQTVNKFADFARLPAVQVMRVDVNDLLQSQLKSIAAMFPTAHLEVDDKAQAQVQADIDTTLFRQVLVNIVRNGIEANPERDIVNFRICIDVREDSFMLVLSNDGVEIPEALAQRIFEPYISGRSGKENMGLGLAIVKKIVIDHGGDIRYVARDGRPEFRIRLPRHA
jgi:nitrogen fixation/metabolism regulation signal transduction histidine kinase